MPPAQGDGLSDALSGRVFAVLGACLALCVFILPISNPDIFWHLSAGRRILQDHAVAHTDWLSWTMSGKPWIDFEWLCGLIWYLVYAHAGVIGLVALKASIFTFLGIAVWAILSLYDLPLAGRGLALAVFAFALLPANDLRADNFSLLFFGFEFLFLERMRIRGERQSGPSLRNPMLAGAFFCLWANLHPGFVYGVILLGVYAGAAYLRDGSKWLMIVIGAALVGSLLNPYGVGLYRVLAEHLASLGELRTYIREWQAPGMKSIWLLPFWLVWIAAFAVGLIRYYRARDLAPEHIAALCLFALFAQESVRMTGYFSIIAVPILSLYLARLARDEAAISATTLWTKFLLFSACFISMTVFFDAELGHFLAWRNGFMDRDVPDHMADFLGTSAPVLGSHRMVNPWQWGGYLGFKLHPEYLVFVDGRYIFHPWLKPIMESRKSAAAFDDFLKQNKIDVVLEKRPFQMGRMPIDLPGNKRTSIERPYYLEYLPRQNWALVFWNDQGAVFARRTAIDSNWISAHEYSIFRPDDFAAAELMVGEGHATRKQLAAEIDRAIVDAGMSGTAADSWRRWSAGIAGAKSK